MSKLIDEAFTILREASDLETSVSSATTSAERCRILEESAAKYNDACFSMKGHIRSESGDSKTKQLLVKKIDHYEEHAQNLMHKVKDIKVVLEKEVELADDNGESINQANHLKSAPSNASCEATQSSHNKIEVIQAEGKARRLLDIAIDQDEQGETIEALQKYMQAAECYSQAIALLSSPQERDGVSTSTGEQSAEVSPQKNRVTALERLKELTINRVNELKNRITTSTEDASSSGIDSAQSKSTTTNDAPCRVIQPNKKSTLQSDKLTPDEIKILSWSSQIASGIFFPWNVDEAKTYNYSPTKPDKDVAGIIPLSDKQKSRFHKWARPSEIVSMRQKLCKIAMINSITPYTIKQYCVSDCSFICGLIISAAFERRFKRRIVSSLIYPQDENGIPIYNPVGIYMVKLWLNGIERRVLVDDQLPVDNRGNLLCSHTKTKGVLELWVCILEKAYMTLCGGYDFPGSNSGVDLFSLTGWIPERLFFPEDPNHVKDFETPVERAWERLYSGNSYGDCLLTVSTSKELTEEDAKDLGLYTDHAYAVLGVVQTSNGTRLLQLKNPWASHGWKGKYSVHDKESWSDPAFCAEVGYDANSAAKYDDGVFYMSWSDLLLYFRNLHLSWSTAPELFRFRTAVHGYWDSKTGPKDDSFNVGENPQYSVTLSDKATNATLWLLLSRHVTKQEQEGAEVTEFLTLNIHRTKKRKQRVYYPDQDCVLSGTYTNNQHVLVRYDATGHKDKYLSIVLSQYKKANDLGYTLTAFCTQKIELCSPIKLPVCCPFNGAWRLRSKASDGQRYYLDIGTCGGPPERGSFGANPQWTLRVPTVGIQIRVKCMAPKELAINVILARQRGSCSRVHQIHEDPVIDTGDYRHGFAVSDATFVPAGLYTLVASTFAVGQEGNFILEVMSSDKVHIKELDR